MDKVAKKFTAKGGLLLSELDYPDDWNGMFHP